MTLVGGGLRYPLETVVQDSATSVAIHQVRPNAVPQTRQLSLLLRSRLRLKHYRLACNMGDLAGLSKIRTMRRLWAS